MKPLPITLTGRWRPTAAMLHFYPRVANLPKNLGGRLGSFPDPSRASGAAATSG